MKTQEAREWKFPCRAAFYYLAAFLLPLLVYVFLTDLPAQRFDIPLGYGHHKDTLIAAPYYKVFHDRENPFRAASLGAPFETNIFIHPINAHVSVLFLFVAGFFFTGYGAAINAAFFFTCMVAGLSAMWSLRRLRVPPGLALAGSLLYVFLPVNTFTGVWHYNLSCMFTPVAGMMALKFMDGGWASLSRRDRGVCLACCVLMGFNDPYEAFFACMAFGIVLAAVLLTGNFRRMLPPLAALAIIAGCGVVNSIPGILAQRANPECAKIMREMYRNPAQVVSQSLEIGTFFLPVDSHYFKPAGRLAREIRTSAGAGQSAMLGSLPTLGLLVLVGAAFLTLMGGASRWRGVPPALGLAGLLALLLLIISSKYGLNIIFAKLVTAQLRGYVRVGKMIGFLGTFGFCAAAAAVWCRCTVDRGRLAGIAAAVLICAVTVAGVADQWPACYVGIYRGWSAHAPDYDDAAGLVAEIEGRMPGGMVFVADSGHPDMDKINGHFCYAKPYLSSRTVRWSVPFIGVGDRVRHWQTRLRGLPHAELAAVVLAAGFDGVWIDRKGPAEQVRAQLERWSGEPGAVRLDSPAGGYAFVDLSETRRLFLKRIGPEAAAGAREAALVPDPQRVRALFDAAMKDGDGPN